MLLGCFMVLPMAACTHTDPSATDSTAADTQNQSSESTGSSSKDSNAQKDAVSPSNQASMPGSKEGGKQYQCIIDIDGYGPVTLILDEGIAPETVKNFVKLVNEGFYNGLTFHRIIDGFMIQGGDPDGNGTGGSGETIPGEFKSNGFNNTLSHKKGVISMARSSNPNSASSQFFIVEEDSTFLDGDYAAFGWVTDGMDIVEKIAEDAKPSDSNGTITKDHQPVINSITVTEIGS